MAKPHLLIEDYAGVAVVTFTDSSILDSKSIEELGEALYHMPDHQHKQKLVLDFTHVKLLSSQTIGVLLTLQKKMKAIKGTLVMCGLRKEVMKLFTITNLDREFKFYKDDAAALESFGVRVK
ncbi:MAG: STAS domain-containing protein [Phycisphaerales bacterium]|nr:STAS domain-containing protein [Phycisphaerales bacterium]